jgi:hypothetical protein
VKFRLIVAISLFITLQATVLVAKPIMLVGFRGGGPRFSEELLPESGGVYTGHIGISFDGGHTIYGFTPKSSNSFGETIKMLRSGDSFPGQVNDDTSMFFQALSFKDDIISSGSDKRKYLKVVTPSGLVYFRLEAYVWEKDYPDEEYERVNRLVFEELINSSGLYKLYGFPGALDSFNCATWPSTVGVEIPESSGALKKYIPELIRRGGGKMLRDLITLLR